MAVRWSRSRTVGMVALVALLSGCGGGGGEPPLESYSAEEIYQRAEFDLENGSPDEAARYFAEVERLYPYSDWAKRALVMQAYALHRDRQYEEARAAAQRFIDYYPADEDAAYASYLLALSYYDQIDEIGRDQGLTFQALQALRDVIETYPDTEYARSAILKFDLAFDHLAAKEMEIGRYYLRHRHHTAEALHRLVEAYLSLGLTSEAQTAGAILGHNFRSTQWYQDSFELLARNNLQAQAQGDSWLAQIYRQTVKGQWL